MKAPKTIMVIGELLWDILPDGKKLGGAPANFAYRLNELGHNAILVSRLGDDALGISARAQLDKHGVNTHFIQTDNQHPTGTVNVFFDENKNPDYSINTSVAFDYINYNDDLSTIAQQSDCIAFGTLAQRSFISGNTITSLVDTAPNATKFFDVNLRKECYTKNIISASLTESDIVKLNHNELIELGKMFSFPASDDVSLAQRLVEKFNLKICLITLEAQGALAVDIENAIHYAPGYQVAMEDPLGAGDAFSAAFVHHYLNGESVQNALDAGNRHGAMVVGQKGAMQPISTIERIDFEKSRSPMVVKNELLKYSEV